MRFTDSTGRYSKVIGKELDEYSDYGSGLSENQSETHIDDHVDLVVVVHSVGNG